MRRKTERQGTEAERQLAWSREYLRREKRRRVLRRTLLMLVLALACAVTVFALNGGIPALRVGGAPASGSSAAQSSSAPAVQAQPPVISGAAGAGGIYRRLRQPRRKRRGGAAKCDAGRAHRRAVVSGAGGLYVRGLVQGRCADGRLGLCRGHGGAGYHFVCKMGGRARAGHNFRRGSAPDGRGHGRIAVGVRAGCGACAGCGGSLAAAQGLPGLNRRRQAKKPLQTQRPLLKEKRKGGERPWTPDL